MFKDPSTSIKRFQFDSEADILQFECRGVDDGRDRGPGPVRGAAQQLRTDHVTAHHEDLLDGGDGGVGPDVGPGLPRVPRGQDFDQQNRVRQCGFAGDEGRAGDARSGIRIL